MRQPEGSRVVLARQVLDAGQPAEWTHVLRVTFSEPVRVQNLRTTFPDGPVDDGVVSGMNHGDLVFRGDSDPPPARARSSALRRADRIPPARVPRG